MMCLKVLARCGVIMHLCRRHFTPWRINGGIPFYINKNGMSAVQPTILKCQTILKNLQFISVDYLKVGVRNNNVGLRRLYATTVSQERHTSLLEMKHFNTLSAFGSLVVQNVAGVKAVSISPLNPQTYPEQNEAFLRFSHLATLEGVNQIQCDKGEKIMDSIQCYLDSDQIVLKNITNDFYSKQIICDVDISLKYDLDIKVQGETCVSARSLENSHIDIAVEHGSCTLKSIKTGTVHLSSEGGDIISEGSLHGNASISTKGHGKVELKKPLCQELHVNTEAGNIHVTDLYADSSSFGTDSGDVTIGHSHGMATVDIRGSGDLNIGSVDGHFTATVHKGNVNIQLVEHTDVCIEVQEGDIRIQLPDSLATEVELEGRLVNISDKLHLENCNKHEEAGKQVILGIIPEKEIMKDSLIESNKRRIVARTRNGCVSLECQDWLSSLNLGRRSAA